MGEAGRREYSTRKVRKVKEKKKQGRKGRKRDREKKLPRNRGQ